MTLQSRPASEAASCSLPDVVRGYEDVKMQNVEAYHRSLAKLRAQLDAPAASTP
jgi:hypothetical protein